MILTVATIRPGSTIANSGKRRHRDCRVDPIEPVDLGTVDDQKAGRLGVEVRAPGEGSFDAHMIAGDRMGKPAGRFVLVDIVRVEPRRDDLAEARGAQFFDLAASEHGALADRSALEAAIEWARIAPSAAATGTGPNFTRPPARLPCRGCAAPRSLRRG